MDRMNMQMARNLRKVRSARGITLSELSDRLLKLDFSMSPQTLSQIENGKRRLYADQVFYICNALECSPANIYPQVSKKISEHVEAAVSSTNEDNMKILSYALTGWHGNTNALWKFMGLYISLPIKLRAAVAGMGVSAYEYAKLTRQIDKKAPEVDIEYIAKEYRRLLE
ncbi:MAG: helix-turn-helix transcriptional regulator [Erysipelotrichaceae bacterium]|nr:helix-turn-helix transcriptional regulator [Erysipelotrichaceae bacterium]